MDNFSIRLALRKIAEITCGIAPTRIRVSARFEDSRRIYRAAIPWDYRDEVCGLLRQKLDLDFHMEGSLLILTESQARAVLDFAYSSDAVEVAASASDAQDRS